MLRDDEISSAALDASRAAHAALETKLNRALTALRRLAETRYFAGSLSPLRDRKARIAYARDQLKEITGEG